LVAAAAKLAALVIERDAARRAAEQDRRRHAFLLELSDAFRVLDDCEAVAMLATRRLWERLGAGSAFVGVFDDAGDSLTLGPGHAATPRAAPVGPVARAAFADLPDPLPAGPYVVPDRTASPAPAPHRPEAPHHR